MTSDSDVRKVDLDMQMSFLNFALFWPDDNHQMNVGYLTREEAVAGMGWGGNGRVEGWLGCHCTHVGRCNHNYRVKRQDQQFSERGWAGERSDRKMCHYLGLSNSKVTK